MADESDATSSKPKRHVLRWLVGGVVLCALVAGVAWFVTGRRVWTDDRTIHVRAADANVREILWTVPESLGEPFNTADQDYEPSISPDGTELFFVRGKAGRNAEIFVSRRVRMKWTDPVPLADVNTPGDDLGPRLTPDGRFLLFYSDRPGGRGGYDLWAAGRRDDGSFAPAFNLGPSVNTEFNEYSPAPTPDGKRLYFATNRKAQGGEQQEAWRATIRQDAVGDYDLFVAVREEAVPPTTGPANGEHRPGEPALTPSPLYPGERAGVRDPGEDGAPNVQRGGTQAGEGAIAGSPTRSLPPSTGPGIAAHGPSPQPSPLGTGERGNGAAPLAYRAAAEVPGVNTQYHEGASCVSTAGDFLYFASNRPGGAGRFDLYRCRLRDDGTLLPPENVGREVNTADNETDPQLATGGFRLYFSSDRSGPAARGGYDLLTSESREVYVLRQDREVPRVGWSWWLLLGALLLLLPLLLMLRGWDDRHLNLLQKCLLVSVLFHVLLTILFSLIFVSRDIVDYVRRGDGAAMEVAVVFEPAGGVDVGSEVRKQFTETPVDMPEPAELAQAQVPADDLAIEPPPAVKVDVPNAARPAADAITVAVPQVTRPPPPAPSDAVAVAPPTVQQVVPQVSIDAAAPRIRSAESEARPTADPVEVARADAAAAPASLSPQSVNLEVAASDARPQSLAEAPAMVKPNLMSIPPAAAAPSAAASVAAAAAQPNVQGPSVPSERIAAAGTELPQASVEAPGLERQAVESAGGGAAVAIETGAPATTRSPATSLTSAATRPTTRPVETGETVAVAVNAPAVANAPVPTVPAPAGAAGERARADEAPVQAAEGPVAAAKQQTETAPAAARPDALADATSAPAADVKSAGAAQPLVSAAPVAPRAVEVAGERTVPAPPAGALAELPKVNVPAPSSAPARASAEEPAAPSAATHDAALASSRVTAPVDAGPRRPQSIPTMTDPPAARPDALATRALEAGDARPRGEIVPVPLNLEVAIPGPRIAAPQPLAQRAPENRRPLVEQLGGTEQSEDAVDRALAYLARQQEPDGRWTYVLPSSQRGRRGRYPHDMALTGLATLCFLASDHTPGKPGPYREVVGRGIAYLVAGQKSNGDLRGPFAGGGADAGNLYDQGICTLALAEAALMTGDPRTTAAATKAAEYIVRAQNRESGGWRYVPGEYGDTSIFGWQVMALHSARQLGFDWPQASRDLAMKYVRIASTGRHKALAGYQPGHGPTPAMSAELLFARILLGDELSPEAVEEVSRYVPRQSPNDFYGSYYASLSLVQLRNEAWTKWNERTREHLVKSQRRGGGEDDGCWDTNVTWGERGGRVYSTALACLTLQVYYRYLPANVEGSTSQPASNPARPDIGYLSR